MRQGWRDFPWNGRMLITVLGPNPKTFHNRPRNVPDARTRFGWYADGMTVDEYLRMAEENGVPRRLSSADVRWDAAHGFIRLDDPGVAAADAKPSSTVDLDKRTEREEEYFGNMTAEELKALLIARAADLQDIANELIAVFGSGTR
jgi:hypothetical protein